MPDAIQFKNQPPSGGFGDNALVNRDVFDANALIHKLANNGYFTVPSTVVAAFRAGAANAYGVTADNLSREKGTVMQRLCSVPGCHCMLFCHHVLEAQLFKVTVRLPLLQN